MINFSELADRTKPFASVTHYFNLKHEKDRNGLCPIYLVVRLNKERKRIPADIKVRTDQWCPVRKIIYNHEQAEDYNLILKQITARITAIEINHRLSETPLTMHRFLEALTNAPPTFDLVAFFFHVIDAQDISLKTIQKHRGTFNKLRDSGVPTTFPDITAQWFNDYRFYLRQIGNGKSTINTNISIIKRYLRLAKEYGVKVYVNLDQVTVGATDGRITWLNYEEISKLKEYFYSSYIPSPIRLSLAYFLFSCYSGCRISDILAFERKQMDGTTLDFISVKTKKRVVVGLSKTCRQIIDAEPRLFMEAMTEQTMNKHLRMKISPVCGITKKISFHVGRHSFATNYLLRGGKVENLQKLLGHSKITTTMKYVHIIDEEAAMTVHVLD